MKTSVWGATHDTLVFESNITSNINTYDAFMLNYSYLPGEYRVRSRLCKFVLVWYWYPTE